MTDDVILTLSLLLSAALAARFLASLLPVPEILVLVAMGALLGESALDVVDVPLDSLGAHSTRIIVTSDLDEYVISALADAPIDGYGVGTRVATGSGHPTASMVYKLVAVADSPGAELRPVAKSSESKASVGGRKTAYRYPDGSEHFTLDGRVPEGAVPLQHDVVRSGEIAPGPTLEKTRDRVAQTLAALPEATRQISDGTAALTATQEDLP